MTTQISNAVVEECFWEQVFPVGTETRVRFEGSLSLLEVCVAPSRTLRGQSILPFERVSNAGDAGDQMVNY